MTADEEFELWFSQLISLINVSYIVGKLPDKGRAKKLFDQGMNVHDAALRLK